MPQVPTYDDFQVAAQDAPNARFDRLSSDISPASAAIGPEQVTKLGQAMQTAGSDVSTIVNNAQNMANQVRVNDAVNQAREAAMQLTYDPQQGYTQQKGLQALQRDSGMPLADEYTQKLKDQISQIGSTLSNPMQQQMFAQHAQDLTSQFYGQAMAHEAQEFHNYNISVQDGTISVSRDAIGKQWQDPDAVQQNVDAIYAAAYQKARLMGSSATEAQVLAQKEASNGHMVAIGQALQNSNLDYAQQYIKRFGGTMDADDLMRASGAVSKQVETATAIRAAQDGVKAAVADANAPPATRFVSALMFNGERTDGRDFDAHGNLITSPAGALGRMQVMPATAANPGYGIAPAKSNSPEDLAEFGQRYALGMLQHFGGNAAQAAAAYNAGPGAVDKAIDKAKEAGDATKWLSYLPQETQSYVGRVIPALQSAPASPQIPTLQDVHQRVRDALGPNATPRQLQIANTQVASMLGDMQKAQKQQGEAATASVIGQLAHVRGDLTQLPPGALESVPPENLTRVIGAAKQFALGTNTTNNAVYAKLADNNYLASLSSNQLAAYQGELSQGDYKHFVDTWQKLQNGTPRDTAQDLDSRGLNSILNNRLEQLGIPTHPKDGSPEAARLGAIQKFVGDSILDAQRNTGKKMQYNDMSHFVDQLFMHSLNFHTDYLGGLYTTHSSQRMLTMQAGDIPSDTRNVLRQDLARQGNTNPTDAELLGAYWKFQSLNHGWRR